MEVTDYSTQSAESATVWRRFAHTRGRWLYLAAAIGAALLIGVAAREAYLLARAPDLGLSVSTGLEVIEADGRWPSLSPGDRIIALAGDRIDSASAWMTAQRDAPAGDVTVAVERGDEAIVATATTTSLRDVHRAALWVRVATGSMLMLLGLAAFFLRPGDRSTWLLLAASWGLGAWMLGETVPALIAPVLVVVMPLAVAMTVQFVLVFPRPLPAVQAHPRLQWLPLAAAGAIVVAGVIPRLVAGTWVGADAHWHALHTARYAALGAGGIGGVWAMALQHRAAAVSDDPIDRARTRGLFVGLVVGLAVPAAWTALRNLGIGESRFAAYYNSVPLLFFVATCAYIAVRHNALAIDRFTAAIAGYAATVAIASLAFTAALFGLPLLLGGETSSPSLLVGLTALVFVTSSALYRTVKRRIDRRFFRDRSDMARTADAMRDLVFALQSDTSEAATRRALALVQTLSVDRVELWELEPDRGTFAVHTALGTRPSTAADAVARDGALGRAAIDQRTGGVEGLAPRALDADGQDELWSLGLALIAPVVSYGATVGFLAVERKRSGAAFSVEDMSLIAIVAAQIGLVRDRGADHETSVGRYRIDRRLGVGGMAEVYLAWQLGPRGFERKVALKRPLPGLAHEPAAIELFLDEARVATRLQHPNIAQVYEVGEADGTVYLALEYIDGPPLRGLQRALADRGERMPPGVAVAIVTCVLDALAHAHASTDDDGVALHIVHRDVTPGNIMLRRNGTPVLVDFGIARAASQVHVTRAGIVRGTLAYMSPEQATGEALDARSDLYAAGAVLYELVTGVKAFPNGPFLDEWQPPRHGSAPPCPGRDADDRTRDAGPPLVRASRGASRPPVPMSARAPGVPRSLDDVFYRAVALRPADRYPDAAAMREALAEATRGVAESAAATGWLQRAIAGGEP